MVGERARRAIGWGAGKAGNWLGSGQGGQLVGKRARRARRALTVCDGGAAHVQTGTAHSNQEQSRVPGGIPRADPPHARIHHTRGSTTRIHLADPPLEGSMQCGTPSRREAARRLGARTSPSHSPRERATAAPPKPFSCAVSRLQSDAACKRTLIRRCQQRRAAQPLILTRLRDGTGRAAGWLMGGQRDGSWAGSGTRMVARS